MNIALGLPSGDMVHKDFAMSLVGIIQYTQLHRPDIKLACIDTRSSIVQKGRHEIVEAAMSINAQKILFLDSDMMFPASIVRDLENQDKDIIGCNYTTRRAPIKPTCMRLDKQGYEDFRISGVREVGYIGTGALLISTDVFRKIGKPYFNITWNAENEQFVGEDYTFCDKAREHGYKVYCHFDLSKQVEHIGQRIFKF